MDVKVRPALPIARRPTTSWQAVRAFVAVAIAFLAWETWTLVAWLADGPHAITKFRDTTDGSWAWARGLEVFSALAAAGILTIIVRGVRRERRFTLDAMFAIAGLTSFWLDPFYNFFRPNLLYSSQWVNVGTWCGHVPFVRNHGCGHVPEPLIFVGLWYLVGVPAAAMSGCALLRWVQRVFPRVRWTTAKLIGTAGAFGAVLDMLWEVPIVHGNLWKYPTYPTWITLPGLQTKSQFPLSTALAGTILFGGSTVVRYFRNDRGETFLESGVAHIAEDGRRTGVRLLASIGLVQALALACIAPIMTTWPYHGPWPHQPAHVVNGLCDQPAPGSYYAHYCPPATRG